MERKILIPIDPVQVLGESEYNEQNEDELFYGMIVSSVLWTCLMTHLSLNPIQFLVYFVGEQLSQSGMILNIFALIGIFFTITSLPWTDILGHLCRLHIRLLVWFPLAVVISILKCIIDIFHSYWCVFAPQSTIKNSAYRFLEHPMERK